MKTKYFSLIIITLSLTLNLFLGWQALAQIQAQGTLDSPDTPANTFSYTLEDLYNRLTNGTAGSQIAFTEPVSGPTAATMHSLNEIMTVAPAVDNTNGATDPQLLAGKTAWGLTIGQWGVITGTMPNNGAGSTIVPTTTDQSVAAGYWSSANTVQGDSDLTATNLISGAEIFGITGTYPLAAIPATGATGCYNGPVVVSCTGTGQDGETQTGVTWTAASRYTDNGDGTVTDNLTQLVWLQDVSCTTLYGSFPETLTAVSGLQDGQCGLSDGSTAGDWRVPNVKELQSMMYYDYGSNPTPVMPSLPDGTPFYRSDGLFSYSGYHWSSTVLGGVIFYRRELVIDTTSDWTEKHYGWAVRGGQ